MKVNDWTIRWDYKISYISIKDTMTPVKLTECNMYKGEPFPYGVISHSGSGRCICGPKDQFNKDKGRRLSLLRAMQNANISKLDRIPFWEVYRNMTNKKRW